MLQDIDIRPDPAGCRDSRDMDRLRAAMQGLPRLPSGIWGPELPALAAHDEFASLCGVYRIRQGGGAFHVLSLQPEMRRRSPRYLAGCDYRDIVVPALETYCLQLLRDVVTLRRESIFVATLPDSRFGSGMFEVASQVVPFAETGTDPTHLLTVCSFSEAPRGARAQILLDDLLPLTDGHGRLSRPERLSAFGTG